MRQAAESQVVWDNRLNLQVLQVTTLLAPLVGQGVESQAEQEPRVFQAMRQLVEYRVPWDSSVRQVVESQAEQEPRVFQVMRLAAGSQVVWGSSSRLNL
jgi:hypothetical protein